MPHTGHRTEIHAYKILSIPTITPDNIHQSVNRSLFENKIPPNIRSPLNAKPSKEAASFQVCLEYLTIDGMHDGMRLKNINFLDKGNILGQSKNHIVGPV